MADEFPFSGLGANPFPDPLSKEPEPTAPPKPFVPPPREPQPVSPYLQETCPQESVGASACDFSPEGMWGKEASQGDAAETDNEAFDEDDKQTLKKVYAGLGIAVAVLIVAVVSVWIYLGKRVEEKKPAEGDVEKNIAAEDAAENEMPRPENPNLIKAAEGGWIVSPEGFEIIVPSGALVQDTEIKVERVAAGPVTDLYRLMPDGLKFLKPVTARIPYKESGLRRGRTPRDIVLDYWSGEGALHAFRTALAYDVDARENKLSAEIREF